MANIIKLQPAWNNGGHALRGGGGVDVALISGELFQRTWPIFTHSRINFSW